MLFDLISTASGRRLSTYPCIIRALFHLAQLNHRYGKNTAQLSIRFERKYP